MALQYWGPGRELSRGGEMSAGSWKTTFQRAGSGTAATEVPRGTLFHSYVLDAEGRVEAADVVTPTAQNLRNAEEQMRATVRDARGVPDSELRHRLEIVARAYDPCISCSVHVVRAR